MHVLSLNMCRTGVNVFVFQCMFVCVYVRIFRCTDVLGCMRICFQRLLGNFSLLGVQILYYFMAAGDRPKEVMTSSSSPSCLTFATLAFFATSAGGVRIGSCHVKRLRWSMHLVAPFWKVLVQ